MPDYIRIGCAVPAVRVGDVKKNVADICGYMEKADAQKVDLVLFPELAMTGYSCADLFFQEVLYSAVDRGLQQILTCSAAHPQLTAVVGLPIRSGMKLFNCAAVIAGGKILGITSKTYLPDYREASESRWFAVPAEGDTVCVCGEIYPVGGENIYKVGDTLLGVEICEDLFAPVSPSAIHALSGAEVVANIAASPEFAGKRARRQELIKTKSWECKCIYAYVSAGCTESTSDIVFAGHSLVGENGALLAESAWESMTDYMLVTDCDLGAVRAERQVNTTLRRNAREFAAHNVCAEHPGEARADGTLYPVERLPFVPSNQQERIAYCRDVFRLQVAGLKQRLSLLGASAVIGISGGLDSTLALLVAVEAMRQLGRPMTDVHGITMPCFGTSDRTYRNAWKLMQTLGITAKEIPIAEAVKLHFRDIGHDEHNYNTTYENSQARERTQILMDYAGTVGGIVVGTGDLSELALGWCTYNGDHMSMYAVNASVPKTLIRWIIEAVCEEPAFSGAKEVLLDVIDTPISPELLPPDAKGNISQQTEDIVGPYALHDFFLYYVLRYGYAPRKIYDLACTAFAGHFDGATVKKWLLNFYRRFFTQQFKRNCVPDGVRVGPVGLSPRGDWQMPSDASARLWLDEVEAL